MHYIYRFTTTRGQGIRPRRNTMLYNLNHSFPSVVKTLEMSKFEFHLTGSRFWGNVTNSSDWDFFVQNSDEIHEWLHANGFERLAASSAYAGDGMCDCVYVLGSETQCNDACIRYLPSNEVHVQVVKSAMLKNSIQTELFRLYPDGFVDKGQARLVWKTAFAFFDFGARCVS